MESIIVCSDEDRGWPEIVKEFTGTRLISRLYTLLLTLSYISIYTICFSPADKFLDGICSAEDLLKKIFR